MYLFKHWRSFFLFIWPFISLILTFALNADSPATRCGFVVIVMAGYWVSECLPLGVTGLIPLFTFPMLGIMGSQETSKEYMNDANQLLFCALIVVLSIEHCNLHKRIAIHIVSWIGFKHLWLTCGIFFCTMFVSMWVANVATVAMVAPITLAILEELEEENLLHVYESSDGKPIIPVDKKTESFPRPPTLPSKTTICYFLGVCWSATIGGVGTLIGASSNMAVKGLYEMMTKKRNTGNLSTVYAVQEISFTSWMLFNVPHMFVSELCVWIALNIMFLGLFVNMVMDEDVKNNKYADKKEMSERLNSVRSKMKNRIQDMGSLTWHEKTVGLLFLVAVCISVFRRPGFMKGWEWNNMMGDTTPATLMALLLFTVPENLNFFTKFWNKEERPTKPGNACMTWEVVNAKMPWSILFLLGGGFALSKGIRTSELDKVIANALCVLNTWPHFIVMFLMCSITTCFTEFTSNIAVVKIIMPIIMQMVENMNMNALYLVIPVGVCCSFAFMVPSGTSGNALILGMINMPEKYMFLAGIAPKIITLGSVIGCVVTVGEHVYDF